MIQADISLPKELVGTVEAEAEAVYQVLGSSLSALVTNDMSIICNPGRQGRASARRL